jgi:hypothetical protein
MAGLLFVTTVSTQPAAGKGKRAEREPAAKLADAPEDAPDATKSLDGVAFVFIKGRGVVRLEDKTTALIVPSKAGVRDLALDEQGGLWASLRDTGLVRFAGGNLTTVNKESFERVAVRSATDVWAINDSHGSVVHWDGERWKTLRTRNTLTGAFDDNRLLDIATDRRNVWIASWNGLWRVSTTRWIHVDPPAETRTGADGESPPPFPLSLVPAKRGMLACYVAGCYLATEAGWQPSRWPADKAKLQAAGAQEMVAGTGADGRTVVIARLDGATEKATSETLPAIGINDIAIDLKGRVWVATGDVLALFDSRARAIGRWQPKAVANEKLVIERVVVAGTGPDSLPSN